VTTFPLDGLPERVMIYEVSPRDGLQNEQVKVPTAVKAEFIHRLVDAGLRVIEATSFVHPTWVPQLADAGELLTMLKSQHGAGGVCYPVVVPNEQGLERALAAGAAEIAILGSATESFAQRNLNRTIAESIAMAAPVVDRATAAGVRVRAYLSMCFGDPWEGPVPIDRAADIGVRLLELGCAELSLGDTIGVGTAGQVTAMLSALSERGVGPDRLAVHFHDTYGQALANTLAALRCGISVVDASAGGLGGCPYARSATGNLATEDLVWLLHGLGIETGVDLDQLVETSQWITAWLGHPSPSRVVQARILGP
jgi:hydroxymethylglutaryl-CoA lyase